MTDVDVRDRCRALFDRHRIEAFGGLFHVPDVDQYPALFAWDSGYHALATLHLDPALAVEELSTLYRSNRLPNGLLSHQRYVPGAEEHQAMIEGLFGPMFDGDRTPFVDPPTSAYAAARISLALGEGADALLQSAVDHLKALATQRVVGSCRLPAALHPFETGTEGSTFMRELLPGTLAASLDRLKQLTVSAVAAEMSPETALAEGHGFVTYDPTVCGWYLLALEEAAVACAARGRDADAEWAWSTAIHVASDLEERLWWDEGHLFVAHDLVGDRTLTGIGAMGLIPAASRIINDRGLSAAIADRHIRPGAPMWGDWGLAAGVVAPGGGVGQFVQWNGNAVWGATSYWGYLAAARLGRRDEAERLRSGLEGLVRAHGFREFYDACTGEPGGAGGASGFTWPALILDMDAFDAT